MPEGNAVRLIFLGGMGEVGKNVLALESGDDIVVIDCGLAFPEEDQPGIDLVLPDISWLRENKDRLRGIFITHGHEDHIGALPWLLGDLLPVPVWATRLTIGLISVKLEEAKLAGKADLREFDPDARPVLEAGVFKLEPFRVAHSIPDAVGFGVHTPAGLVVVTGDFKFDPTPIDGRPTDEAMLSAFGDRGVRLLITDSVHVEAPGHTPSERVIGDTYDEVFAEADGRIFVATFASLIARIQQVVDTAGRHGRLVAPLGRSLVNNVRIARELGYLNDPENVIVDARDAGFLPDDRIVYVLTGAQGEPMAALSRVANGDHRDVSIGEGDTVVVSATPIPGNETAVSRVIDKLFRAGAEVIYGRRALVHVSGHASQDELRRMLELTRPRDVIPTHGEARHMALYADLAIDAGWDRDRVHFLENGLIFEFTAESAQIAGKVAAGALFVDGGTVGEVGDVVVRDRRALARDGVLMVAVTIDRRTGDLVAGPEIATRGFVHVRESAALLDAVKDRLRAAIVPLEPGENGDRREAVSRLLRDAAAQILFRETGRRPIVLPVVLEA
jgi:ribonuclease J